MAKRKNWFSLFFTNYLGVLNDNFLKTLACFICIAWVGKENESMVVTLASAVAAKLSILAAGLSRRLGSGETPPEGMHNKLIIKGDDHNEQG